MASDPVHVICPVCGNRLTTIRGFNSAGNKVCSSCKNRIKWEVRDGQAFASRK